jgi:hypothetical protein
MLDGDRADSVLPVKLLLIFIALCGAAFGAITLDGSCTSSTTACTVGTGGMGASANGDLMIAFGERIASTTAPTLPGSNTSIRVSSGGATTSFRVWCHVASGTGDGTGTATNATGGVVAFWLSGTAASTTAACATAGSTIGITTGQEYSASGTSITIAGLTTSSGNTSSWIVTFTGTNTSGNACIPAGTTAGGTTQAGYVAGGTTNGAVMTWAQTSCTITTSVARSFALEIFAAPPACSSCTPQLVQVADNFDTAQMNSGSWTSIATGQTYSLEFGQPTQAGNAIELWVMTGVTAIDFTVADNAAGSGNSYYCYQEATTNSDNVVVCFAPNASVASKITITATATFTFYSIAPLEITNVGLLDVTPVGNTATSATITSGSFTPATSGDFVCQGAFQDGTVASTTFTVGSQSNITWAFAAQDRAGQAALQCGVYSSTSALNPTFSQGSSEAFGSLSIALKPSSAGSLPTGPYITALKHLWLTTSTQSYYTDSPRTEAFACPASSNLAVLSWSSINTDSLTAVTINGSSMTATGASYSGSSDAAVHEYYLANNTLGPNQTLVMTGSFAGASAIAFCATGTGTWSFNATSGRTTNSGNSTGTGTTLGPTISGLVPLTSKGIMFVQVAVDNNTMSGVTLSGSQFVSCYWSGEPISIGGCDQNDGWAITPFSSTASQSYTWNVVSSSTAVDGWAAAADEFDLSSSTTAPCVLGLIGAGTC